MADFPPDVSDHLSDRVLWRDPYQHMHVILHHMPFENLALAANSWNTGPRNLRIFPYHALFRPSGTNTT